MNRLQKLFTVGLFCASLMIPRPCRADIFGGDVVVLTQILANAIQQLIQLRQILSTGSDTTTSTCQNPRRFPNRAR